MARRNRLIRHSIEKHLASFLSFVCISFIILTECLCADNLTIPEGTPADISYVVVDLKYSEQNGVQICEIQQGVSSRYKGHCYLYGDGDSITPKFVDKLSSYNKPVWYLTGIVGSDKKKNFLQKGFIPVSNVNFLKNNKLFREAASRPLKDVADISSYHGLLIGHRKASREIREEFPGILVLDFPFCPFRRNKMDMNELLRNDDVLWQYKPQCGVYAKGSDRSTVNKVLSDIESKLLVIKPNGESLGRGIIILKRGDLEKTLNYIFSKSQSLKKDPDPSYNWWAEDKEKFFIVEEFVPSDAVYVPHLRNLPFDPTMRAVYLLIYNQGIIETHVLGYYWKLPKYSLASTDSLIDRHKSYGKVPYFAKVDSEIWKKVEIELDQVFNRLYRILLSE